MSFHNVAKQLKETYGVQYDKEEEFVVCPECDEPLYKDDWDEEELSYRCPVCHYKWEF